MTLAQLVNVFLNLINILIAVVFALVFLFLVWKVIDSWILHADDEQKRAEGKQVALTAVLVVFIMAVVWGIVAIIRNGIFGI